MSDNLIKHAIIGAGFGAKVHLPAFMSSPKVRLVALSDSGSGVAKNIVPKGVCAYSDWKRMIDLERPNSLSVVAPPNIQNEIVIEALARGINVLCEKPFGISIEQALAMESSRKNAEVIGAVGFQYRYEPGIKKMKALLDNGEIGPLNRLDISWLTAGRANSKGAWSWQHDSTQGGGVLNAFVTHVFDLLFWLSNQSALAIFGSSRILVGSRMDSDGNLRKVTAEDSVDAIVEMDSNLIANLRVTNCQQNGTGMRITAYGDHGWIEFRHVWPFGAEDASLIVHSGTDATTLSLTPEINSEVTDTRMAPMASLIADYCTAVNDNSNPIGIPSFADAIKVHRTIKVLRESSLTPIGSKT
jgi:predicted dehydrogenase